MKTLNLHSFRKFAGSAVLLVLLLFSSLTAKGQVTITTTTLPDGVKDVAYSATLTASTGTGNLTWSITGGAIPNGLTLSANTGAISGTPTAVGTFNFTVKVTRLAGGTDSKSLSITIIDPPVCSIGVFNYTSLDDALAAVPVNTQTTILLLQDITHTGGCSITNKKITFDLNGKDIVFRGTTTAGLTLSNSTIGYSGSGNLKVISSGNDGLNV